MHHNLKLFVVIFFLVACQSPQIDATEAPAQTPGVGQGDAFWKHWSDGQAEIAGYKLTMPRYSQERAGYAVAIFVTETMNHQTRVKTDAPQDASHYPVMKLNLIKDFQTGIYDYNTMLSAFVTLSSNAHLPVGHVSKLSFSSQEWCGHVYHQLLFERGKITETSHSYFENEADISRTFKTAPHVLSEDTLLLWARGMSGPKLAPGEQTIVPMLNSLQRVRLDHATLQATRATLGRHPTPETITTPAGTFETSRYIASIEGGQTWEIFVENAFPNRVVKWENSGGEKAELQGMMRVAYWAKQRNDHSALLSKLGLAPLAKPKAESKQ
ncbi:MAG: hypothetical protein HOK97_12350 [Deltaproteobacteria bacterium]|nr:hypothetical protein [Deltaproteobacteria bacterium]MBT6490551.1 hypothetical protein [Deltaproteobacteria bacterium]